jgi:LytS/YehU family sensor histidine kinase
MNLLSLHRYASVRLFRNLVFWILFTFYHASGKLNYYPLLFLVLVISYGIPCYLNNLWLIPRYLQKRRFGLYTLLFAGLLAITTVESYYITHFVNNTFDGLNYMGEVKDVALPSHAFPSLLMFVMLAFAKFTADSFITQQKLEAVEKEKLSGELESLKSQINPHFLFNSLNTIYGLSMRNSNQTPEAVLRLSDILRYVLYDSDTAAISVKQEMIFIGQYLEFARLRQRRNVMISTDITTGGSSLSIAPLLLLPLVENAIKHGLDKNISDPWIDLKIAVNEQTLVFECTNSNSQKYTNGYQAKGGIGLRNVKRRLDLIYHNRYDLQITDEADTYKLNLKIELQ